MNCSSTRRAGTVPLLTKLTNPLLGEGGIDAHGIRGSDAEIAASPQTDPRSDGPERAEKAA